MAASPVSSAASRARHSVGRSSSAPGPSQRTNSKTRADAGGTYAPDSHDVTVTMTSGYPAMNVTYVLR